MFAFGHAFGNDASAGLHIHLAVFHNGGAQHDASVHFAIRREIANTAGIDAALVPLQLVDDLHGPHLRRSRNGARRKARDQRVDGVVLCRQLALDVGYDVHHLAVIFQDELIGDLD